MFQHTIGETSAAARRDQEGDLACGNNVQLQATQTQSAAQCLICQHITHTYMRKDSRGCGQDNPHYALDATVLCDMGKEL